MSNKEKIRAEIERRYNERDRIGDDIRANVHKSLISFIDSMQEEPVSEDLEEAAKQYGDELDNVLVVSINDDNSIGEYATQAFKAGAKWQKEQMMAKSIYAVVSQVPCSNEIILYNPSSVDRYYLPQEMNKLGLNKGDKVKLVIIKED